MFVDISSERERDSLERLDDGVRDLEDRERDLDLDRAGGEYVGEPRDRFAAGVIEREREYERDREREFDRDRERERDLERERDREPYAVLEPRR